MPLLKPLNPPLPPWPDARVWVIGASYGIGAEVAKALLAAGARVALSARSADKLATVAGDHPRALLAPLDFTDGAAVRAAWATLGAAWGGCDLVLVVAGTHREIRAWELNEADADALLATNLNAPIATVAARGAGAAGAGSRRDRPGRQRGRLRRAAQGADLRRVEGGADQLHRDALPRPAAEGPRRLPDQPRLRRDAADGEERLRDAAPDQRRRSRARNRRRPASAATSRSTSRARSRAS